MDRSREAANVSASRDLERVAYLNQSVEDLK